MTLIIAISLIMAVVSFTKGYIFIGILCLSGPMRGFGMFALIVASIMLIINGNYIMSTILIILILWNIVGTKILLKTKIKEP